MTNIAIRVENLSKQYHVGGPQARYKTIRALWNRPLLQSLRPRRAQSSRWNMMYSTGLAFAVAAHRSTWLTATSGAGDHVGRRGATRVKLIPGG